MLRLGDQFVTFEPCSSATDIFFDKVTQRVCTVRENGEMGVTAKNLNEKDDIISFRVSNRGKIKSVNFSTDSQIASLHRDDFSVDFVFLEQKVAANSVLEETKQMCRRTNCEITNVEWVSERNVVFITKQGLELFLANSKRKSLKFLKEVDITIQWSLYYPPSQLLLLSIGLSSAMLCPFIVQSGIIHKLSRFEVDFGCSAGRTKLMDRDVTISSIYDRVSVLVLKSGQQSSYFERINIYEFSSTDPSQHPVLTRTLRLGLAGLVGVQVIDNLVFVHHKNSLKTLVFDTSLVSNQSKLASGPVCYTSIQVADKLAKAFDSIDLSLYLNAWVILPPNLVIEARFGIFSALQVVLDSANALTISDYNTLLDFIIKRKGAEQIFLNVFKKCLLNKSVKISKICDIFEHILDNQQPTLHKLALKFQLSSSQYHLSSVPFHPLQIDHNTIMRNVFDPLKESQEMDKKFLSCLVLEFFLLVQKKKISMENHYLPDLLVDVLVDAKQFNKLQQLLQYRVINDSKFLAFKLISLGKTFPGLHQMAIDMLSRRDNKEQIAEVLISQGKFVEAVRCTKDLDLDKTFWYKLLEAVWRTEDRHVKYTVYLHLSHVKKLSFLDGNHEDFNKFTRDFGCLFSSDEIEEAQKRFRLARIPSIRSPSLKNNSISLDESISTLQEPQENLEENESLANLTNGTLMLRKIQNFSFYGSHWITWVNQLSSLQKKVYLRVLNFGWSIFNM